MSEELTRLKTELAELAASMKANHLKFAKAWVDGKTQEQAYKIAGGKGKNPNSDAANYLSTNPTISKYKELVQKIAAIELLPKQVATLEQKRELLWKIAQHDSQLIAKGGSEEDDGDLSFRDSMSVHRSIAELNKMDGHLAAIKTDSTVKSTVSFRLNLAGK